MLLKMVHLFGPPCMYPLPSLLTNTRNKAVVVWWFGGVTVHNASRYNNVCKPSTAHNNKLAEMRTSPRDALGRRVEAGQCNDLTSCNNDIANADYSSI